MFPEMDTLLLVFAVNCAFLAVLFLILWRRQAFETGGMGEWGSAYLLLSVWAICLLALPKPLAWINGALLGLLWGAGLLLLYEGVRRFMHRPRNYRLSQVLFALMALLHILAALQQNIALRYFSAAFMLVMLFSLTLLNVSKALGNYAATRIFAVMTLGVTLAFCLRLVSVLTSHQQVGLYALTSQQVIVNSLFCLSLPLMGMGLLLLLANQRVQKQWAELATRDPLTGLYNRRAFLTAASVELDRSRRYGSALALVQIDLDQFKRVNDNYGHQAGDRVLIDFATRVTGLLRSSDVFARMGGEEFTVLLPQTGLAEALALAERIRKALTEAEITPGYTASLGVATTQGGAPSLETLMSIADEALYRAKSGGRNRVELGEA